MYPRSLLLTPLASPLMCVPVVEVRPIERTYVLCNLPVPELVRSSRSEHLTHAPKLLTHTFVPLLSLTEPGCPDPARVMTDSQKPLDLTPSLTHAMNLEPLLMVLIKLFLPRPSSPLCPRLLTRPLVLSYPPETEPPV